MKNVIYSKDGIYQYHLRPSVIAARKLDGIDVNPEGFDEKEVKGKHRSTESLAKAAGVKMPKAETQK